MNRGSDWLAQADITLEVTHHLRHAGDHAWACFTAQQAAEFALKGLLETKLVASWGHDLSDLLTRVGGTPPGVVIDACSRLNKHYIAPRYPDAFPSGVPGKKYVPAESAQALADAEEVLRFARSSAQSSQP